MTYSKFDTKLPFPDIFPKAWDSEMGARDFVAFRNLDHFKHHVSKLTQREDSKCGVSYREALSDLMLGKSNFPETERAEIRNLVRSNLHKRGLITEEVYEAYQYSVDGTNVGVDVGKYAAGEPDCVITPSKEYVDFFYELYVSISYYHGVADEDVRRNTAKLLATIEELERQHIFIKITLVFPDRYCAEDENGNDTRNFFSSIPLFSHKDPKSVEIMSSVVNERLLRKFYFAILESFYGKDLASGYGIPVDLTGVMNIGSRFDEIAFFSDVLEKVGA